LSHSLQIYYERLIPSDKLPFYLIGYLNLSYVSAWLKYLGTNFQD